MYNIYEAWIKTGFKQILIGYCYACVSSVEHYQKECVYSDTIFAFRSCFQKVAIEPEFCESVLKLVFKMRADPFIHQFSKVPF